MRHIIVRAAVLMVLAAISGEVQAMAEKPALPPEDTRGAAYRDTDTPVALATYESKAQWQARAARLRRQVLASAGLLPMPEKSALQARIFGRIDRDGYSVEKVCFQSWPGFYVTGNLYRPLTGKPPYPAILSPHGHWGEGRLANEERGSVPGRAIMLARLGFIVFSYSMVGYNENKQVPHLLDGKRTQLWGVSLMGLQLWNSIRALDFLCSLPQVDKNRIGCTGASGGGTQTFLLTTVDDRVAAAAPVNMISAHFQGGCICENGPNLRLGTNNLEFAAAFAPKPLLMVSATGDWTKNTPTVEFPWVQGIYRLFGEADHVATVQIDDQHNYNRESREAVYAWMRRWLQGAPADAVVKEEPFTVEPAEDLLLRQEDMPGRLTTEELVALLIARAQEQFEALWPKNAAGLARFRREYEPAYRAALAVEPPPAVETVVEPGHADGKFGYTVREVALGRAGAGDRVAGLLYTPAAAIKRHPATLVVHGEGLAALDPKGDALHPLIARLLAHGRVVLALDCQAPGDLPPVKFFTTYNLTPAAERVQDVLTAVTFLKQSPGVSRVEIVGLGAAGPWCLLARALAPGVSACAAEVGGLDPDDEEALARDLFIPLLLRAGGLRTAVALPAPAPLLLSGAGDRWGWAEDLYRAAGKPAALSLHQEAVSETELVAWLAGE